MRNNIIEIVLNESNGINFFPINIFEEVIQNIKILLSTIIGSVPLDRKLGIDINLIDDPIYRAKIKFIVFATESIQEYEPRFQVTEITFKKDLDGAMDGKLYPVVRGRVKDEYIT